MTAITERVAAGAAFLDEHDPPWWREIDLGELNLGSASKCILGQRCPLEVYATAPPGETPYSAFARELSGETYDTAADLWARDRGFQAQLGWGVIDGEYNALTAEWRRLITARREAAPPCPSGCGCLLGTEDADRRECGCEGPCTA